MGPPSSGKTSVAGKGQAPGRIKPGVELHGFLSNLLEQRWRKYRKAFKRCRRDFSDETLHEWRIETRRMLALLGLLHPFHPDSLGDLEPLLKKLFKKSAPLRDAQVQLETVEKHLRACPALKEFQRWLERYGDRLAGKFESRIAEGLTPNLKKSVCRLEKWFRQWLKKKAALEGKHVLVVERGVATAHAKVREARRAVKQDEPETIHRVRIAFKAYRYMVETLAPVLVGADEKLLEQMRSYQTCMGEIQDAEVLLAMLRKFEQEYKTVGMDAFRSDMQARLRKSVKIFLKTPLPALAKN